MISLFRIDLDRQLLHIFCSQIIYTSITSVKTVYTQNNVQLVYSPVRNRVAFRIVKLSSICLIEKKLSTICPA